MKFIEIRYDTNDKSYKDGDTFDLGPIARYFGYKPLDVKFIGNTSTGKRVFKLPDERLIIDVSIPFEDYNFESGEGIQRIRKTSKSLKNIYTTYVEADKKKYYEYYQNHNW